MEWQPIETAPKDGTIIQIGWKLPEDEAMQEYFIMQWGHIQKNSLFSQTVGMWVCPHGSFTWNDSDPDGAPTHWKPFTQSQLSKDRQRGMLTTIFFFALTLPCLLLCWILSLDPLWAFLPIGIRLPIHILQFVNSKERSDG